MDTKKLLAELQKVKRANEEFFSKYRDEILEHIDHDGMGAEEFLIREVMLELLERMDRVSYLIDYVGKEVIEEGTLSRDKDGRILFNGRMFPLLRECEVYLYDEELRQHIWTRTFACLAADGQWPYLVGLGRNWDINGMKARFREADPEEKSSF